jgi:hypothetical protein
VSSAGFLLVVGMGRWLGVGQVGLTGSQSGLRVLPIGPTSAPNRAYECSQYGLRVLPIRPTSAPNTAYECSQYGLRVLPNRGLAIWRKASRASKVLVCGPRFWVRSRFLVGFWSFLVDFGSRLTAVLRFYLTFRISSALYHVFLSADGQSTVRAI